MAYRDVSRIPLPPFGSAQYALLSVTRDRIARSAVGSGQMGSFTLAKGIGTLDNIAVGTLAGHYGSFGTTTGRLARYAYGSHGTTAGPLGRFSHGSLGTAMGGQARFRYGSFARLTGSLPATKVWGGTFARSTAGGGYGSYGTHAGPLARLGHGTFGTLGARKTTGGYGSYGTSVAPLQRGRYGSWGTLAGPLARSAHGTFGTLGARRATAGYGSYGSVAAAGRIRSPYGSHGTVAGPYVRAGHGSFGPPFVAPLGTLLGAALTIGSKRPQIGPGLRKGWRYVVASSALDSVLTRASNLALAQARAGTLAQAGAPANTVNTPKGNVCGWISPYLGSWYVNLDGTVAAAGGLTYLRQWLF